MKRIWTDRSRSETYQRCKRLRWLEYHEGSAERGLSPVRKSIHLIIGGAYHAGMEQLLRNSQAQIDAHAASFPESTLAGQIEVLFSGITPAGSYIALIEQAGVDAALAELMEMARGGVEVDQIEQPQQPAVSAQGATQKPAGDAGGSLVPVLEEMVRRTGQQPVTQHEVSESPIVIEFGDFDASSGQFGQQVPAEEGAVAGGKLLTMPLPIELATEDWSQPQYTGGGMADAMEPQQLAIDDARLEAIEVANEQAATGMTDPLVEELRALVEAMVRAYARRRLRPLLTEFEVLEVEREGAWKLSDVEGTHAWTQDVNGVVCRNCGCIDGSTAAAFYCPYAAELWFASRHDALLLERSTNFLYLQSYKTTGSWDRRKAADAEIDMQGLSEAVDVERRFSKAWDLLMDLKNEDALSADQERWLRSEIAKLVSERTAEWIQQQPDAPRILGVRYEYVLKGQRREDKRARDGEPRWVQDTPLIRAYRQEGITGDDRRWSHNYDWFDASGKSRRLDYKSWHKKPVWRSMPILTWINLLDAGMVQSEAMDEDGLLLDPLSEQFIAPVVVYRQDADMSDMLEQLEAQERQIALDVEAVRACGGDEVAKRHELNRRFPQTRHSCSWPGKCPMWECCHGSYEIRRDPEASGLFAVRTPNHPQELEAGNG